MRSLVIKACLFCLVLSHVSFGQSTLVKDIWPGSNSSNPYLITPYDGKLYMYANDGVHGQELWSFDGVNPPTLVADLYPGSFSSGYSLSEEKGVVLNNKLYIPANNGTTGNELYSYDGVNFTTVTDIAPGTGSSYPMFLCALNGKVYFSASASAGGSELYSYDPASNSTTQLTFHSPPSMYTARYLISFMGKIYFRGTVQQITDHLYCYNPVSNTVTDISATNPQAGVTNPRYFVTLNNKLYFAAQDQVYGYELFVYDGSSPPMRLTDLAPGFAGGLQDANYNTLCAYKGRLYFDGSDGNGQDRQLYSYDPQSNVASLIAKINPVSYSLPTNFIVYGNCLYFNAYGPNGDRLMYIYDGSSLKGVFYGGGEYTVWNNKLFMNSGSLLLGRELYCLTEPLASSQPEIHFSANVYPNPSGGKYFFEVAVKKQETFVLQIFDIYGKEIFTDVLKVADKATFPVSLTNAPGIYIYRLTSGNSGKSSCGTLVKEK